MIYKVLFLIASILVSSNAYSVDSIMCSTSRKGVLEHSYQTEQRGKVVTYLTPEGYTPQPADLICAMILQMWENKDSFPHKTTTVVASKDFLTSLILQLNLEANSLILTTVNIDKAQGITKDGHPAARTVWLIFPDPLKRLEEMIRQSVLPLATKEGTKANYIVISLKDVILLATGSTDSIKTSGSITITEKINRK